MLASCMPEPRQFRVVKDRQLCRYTDHAHLTYAHSFQTYGFSITTYGDTNCAISPLWKWKSKFPPVRFLVFAHSACRYKKVCVKCFSKKNRKSKIQSRDDKISHEELHSFAHTYLKQLKWKRVIKVYGISTIPSLRMRPCMAAHSLQSVASPQ